MPEEKVSQNHTSYCCLDLDHKGYCKRWMKLPPNSAYPHFKEIHLQDDWCPKAGCRPASRCDIDAYRGKAQPLAADAGPRCTCGHSNVDHAKVGNRGCFMSGCPCEKYEAAVPPTPQEAADTKWNDELPRDNRFHDPLSPALAPDWAMRVARQIVNLPISDMQVGGEKAVECVAALIRQAGSECGQSAWLPTEIAHMLDCNTGQVLNDYCAEKLLEKK